MKNLQQLFIVYVNSQTNSKKSLNFKKLYLENSVYSNISNFSEHLEVGNIYVFLKQKYLKYLFLFLIKLSLIFNFYFDFYSNSLLKKNLNNLEYLCYFLFFIVKLKYMYVYSKYNFYMIFSFFFFKKFIFLFKKKMKKLVRRRGNKNYFFLIKKNKGFLFKFIKFFKKYNNHWLIYFIFTFFLSIVYIFYNKIFFNLFLNKFYRNFSIKLTNFGSSFNFNFIKKNYYNNIMVQVNFIKNIGLLKPNYFLIRLFQYFLGFDIKRLYKRTIPSLVRFLIKKFFYKLGFYKKFVFRLSFKGRMSRRQRAEYLNFYTKKRTHDSRYLFSRIKFMKINFLSFPLIMQFGVTNVSMLIFYRKKILKKKKFKLKI